jgi:hypothetical protein
MRGGVDAGEFLVSEVERNCSGKKEGIILEEKCCRSAGVFVAFLFVELWSFMLLDMKIHEVAMMRSY